MKTQTRKSGGGSSFVRSCSSLFLLFSLFLRSQCLVAVVGIVGSWLLRILIHRGRGRGHKGGKQQGQPAGVLSLSWFYPPDPHSLFLHLSLLTKAQMNDGCDADARCQNCLSLSPAAGHAGPPILHTHTHTMQFGLKSRSPTLYLSLSSPFGWCPGFSCSAPQH